MHPNAAHVAAVLDTSGVSGEVVELPDRAATAEAAAEQLGCPVGAIANSLIFRADESPLLVLTSGAHRVDTRLLAEQLELGRIERGDPDFVRAATGQPIGGVAPVGHPSPIRTVVDVALEDYDPVWASAGHPHTVFRTGYTELLRITGGTPAKVGA